RHTRFSRDWSSDVCSSDLIFVTRLSAVTLGGVMGEPRLAIALFSISGILTYGYLIKALFGFVNLGIKRMAVQCAAPVRDAVLAEIGRASCRERVWVSLVDG